MTKLESASRLHSISVCQESDIEEDLGMEPDMFLGGGQRLRGNARKRARGVKDGSRVFKIFKNLGKIINIFTSCFRNSQSDL